MDEKRDFMGIIPVLTISSCFYYLKIISILNAPAGSALIPAKNPVNPMLLRDFPQYPANRQSFSHEIPGRFIAVTQRHKKRLYPKQVRELVVPCDRTNSLPLPIDGIQQIGIGNQ